MKKILLSVTSLVFAGAVLAGGTGAFVGDTQVSSGNTFANGVIDLKVDNESYVTSTSTGKLIFSTSTSWLPSDLLGKLFFNFTDVKPGDVGEDTISLHINDNDAWGCMKVNLTSTPENGVNEPEALVDSSIGPNQGELQNVLVFAFWADDGDNVYEKGEKIFKQGYAKDIFNDKWWTLADTSSNIWQEKSGGWSCNQNGDWNEDTHGYKDNTPIKGGSTVYIGKIWCFGKLTADPLNQDGKGKTGTNGPLNRGTGFKCDGSGPGNKYQSDGIKVDVTFSAIQSRDNGKFMCGDTKDEGGGYGGHDGDKPQYCSPGYWKQDQHFDSWAGYTPNQKFQSVFENAFPNLTLLQVLSQGGGGLNALGRATVSALLNSTSVNSPYTAAQVILMFNAVYPGTSSQYDALAASLTLTENCPLN